jgi:uncharacterized protein YndB with AHSA1/START domain
VVADPDEHRHQPAGEGARSGTFGDARRSRRRPRLRVGKHARSGQTCAGEDICDATEEEVARGFEAIKSVVVNAPRAKVWDALTNPAKVAQYMHGTNLSTDWRVGSPIIWRGEWKGHSYVDKGTVLAFEPERLLATTHWSPMGGTADAPENYHTVTYELAEEGGRTTLTLTQDNNATQAEADAMAEKNWGPVLQGLKATAEK